MAKINKGLFIVFILLSGNLVAQKHTSTIGLGWANTSVNTVSFRKNSLVTHKNMQYAAYYDVDSVLILAKRKMNEKIWEVKRTPYKGNVLDTHNAISIMVDGDGYIHVAWNHHNNQLNYCISVEPYSLELTKKKIMIGSNEKDVTYPEFHRLPGGDLIFLYRSGELGEGNLVMNRYNVIAKKWKRVQTNLIDGEKQRNAYWQTFVDVNGVIHLSWIWRETSDVSTNHDLCYARSNDGGITWQNTTNEKYTLPIRQDNSEYACRIAKGSDLINQTSMYVEEGKIYIATYWRISGGIPQYFLVEHNGVSWTTHQVSNRTLDFSLSGGGTKKIPIARPEIVVRKKGKKEHEVILIYRDEEKGNHISIFVGNPEKDDWTSRDLTITSVGSWEPSYDTELWRTEEILDLFVQQTGHGDGEKVAKIGPQPVTVLQWDGKKK